ncbi:hypothetical protein VFDL14_14085 [Vibrio fortis]|jgi:ABC-type phosphate transport system auxiliary subunit|uniref:Uncharacterized protein n=1 Tax=Vibrio fortis TaxID=212667 RepID=A0A066UQG3_9VIBR|nr:hypothetical protein [Vibrio fortis]KDN29310.1 hypothetical protein VFDL14_14085 [Vibrio fortis]
MNQSESNNEESNEISQEACNDQDKLRTAYVKERTNLEVVEIELNRSKIMMIDEQGRKRRVPILSEH